MCPPYGTGLAAGSRLPDTSDAKGRGPAGHDQTWYWVFGGLLEPILAIDGAADQRLTWANGGVGGSAASCPCCRRAKPVFVGRAAETAAAEQGWAAVRSGTRELIFIGGEPGAGKSRLVEEIAAALHRRGAVVLMGTCSPEPGPRYEPFAECLEQLLGGTADGVLAEHMGGSAGELLRLTPLVRRHCPDLQPPPGDDSDYRRELF